MKTAADRNGAKLIIYYVPASIVVSDPEKLEYNFWEADIHDTTRFDINRPYEILQTLCNNNKIPVFNMTKALKSYPAETVYFRGSWHWNKYGHKAVADELTKIIREEYMDTDTVLSH